MNLSPLNAALALAGIILLGVLTAVMVRRRLYRQFPLFFLYSCYAVAASIVVNAASLGAEQAALIKIYSATEALYALTGLLAMYESFHRVFSLYYFSRRWLFVLPLVTVLVILIVSILSLRKHSPVQADALGLFYLGFDLAADYMLAGFFGLFVILVFLWQARWQRYPFGIMKGFGLFSIVGMLAGLLRSEFGTGWDFFFSYAPSVAYILGCLIWLGAFLAPDKAKHRPGPGAVVELDEILELLSKLTKAIK